MGKFCTNCGKALQEGASFCGECGAEIVATSTSNNPILEITEDLEDLKGLYMGKPRHLLIKNGNLMLKTDIKIESENDVIINPSDLIEIKIKMYVSDKKDEGVALFCQTERECKIKSSLDARKEKNCFIYRSNKSNEMLENLALLLKEKSRNFKGVSVFSVDYAKEVKEEQEAIEREEKLIRDKAGREKELNTVRCPMCHSTNLSANNKGFGLGKAIVGGLLIGTAGLAAGGMGAGKVKLTCLKCGHRFNAGQGT